LSFQPVTPAPVLAFSHSVTYVREPMVEIEVAATDSSGILLGTAQRASVMVDSGADYTILDERLAPYLGVDLAQCRSTETIAFGGEKIPGRWRYLKIGICGQWIDAFTVFQQTPQPQILGRDGIFDRLAITFLQRDRQLLAAAA